MSAGNGSDAQGGQPCQYVDADPFWQGLREGRLVLQYCLDAQRFQHPPGPVSIYTGRRRLSWRPVSGAGRVHAFTTLRTKGLGADGRLPYLLALIELHEGARILAHLHGPADAEWRIGDEVVLDRESTMREARHAVFTKRGVDGVDDALGAESATAVPRIDA
ncbi:MAG: Zn-ribbon domain-containing OB-fold protein [Burkholderiaceae bacterium]